MRCDVGRRRLRHRAAAAGRRQAKQPFAETHDSRRRIGSSLCFREQARELCVGEVLRGCVLELGVRLALPQVLTIWHLRRQRVRYPLHCDGVLTVTGIPRRREAVHRFLHRYVRLTNHCCGGQILFVVHAELFQLTRLPEFCLVQDHPPSHRPIFYLHTILTLLWRTRTTGLQSKACLDNRLPDIFIGFRFLGEILERNVRERVSDGPTCFTSVTNFYLACRALRCVDQIIERPTLPTHLGKY